MSYSNVSSISGTDAESSCGCGVDSWGKHTSTKVTSAPCKTTCSKVIGISNRWGQVTGDVGVLHQFDCTGRLDEEVVGAV